MSDIVEVPFAYLCFEVEAKVFHHGCRLIALCDAGVFDGVTLCQLMCQFNRLGLSDVVTADSLCRAGHLLPKDARVFGWIDSTGSRFVQGYEERGEALTAGIIW